MQKARDEHAVVSPEEAAVRIESERDRVRAALWERARALGCNSADCARVEQRAFRSGFAEAGTLARRLGAKRAVVKRRRAVRKARRPEREV